MFVRFLGDEDRCDITTRAPGTAGEEGAAEQGGLGDPHPVCHAPGVRLGLCGQPEPASVETRAVRRSPRSRELFFILVPKCSHERDAAFDFQLCRPFHTRIASDAIPLLSLVKCIRSVPAYLAETLYYAMKASTRCESSSMHASPCLASFSKGDYVVDDGLWDFFLLKTRGSILLSSFASSFHPQLGRVML